MSAPRTHTVSFVSDVETTPSVTGPHDELHHSSQGSVSLSQASNGSALGFTRSFSYTPGMVFNPDSTAAASFLAAAGSCDTLLSHTDMFLPDFGANSCDGAGIPIPNNSASSTTPGAASSYHGSSSGLVLGSVAETPSPTGEFMPGMGAEPAVRRMSVDRSTPLHAPQRHLPWGTPVGMGSCDDTRSLFDTASEGGLEMYTRQASVPVGIPAVASVSAVDLNGVRGDLDYMFRPSSCPPAQFMALPQQGSGSLSRAPTAGSLPWAQVRTCLGGFDLSRFCVCMRVSIPPSPLVCMEFAVFLTAKAVVEYSSFDYYSSDLPCQLKPPFPPFPLACFLFEMVLTTTCSYLSWPKPQEGESAMFENGKHPNLILSVPHEQSMGILRTHPPPFLSLFSHALRTLRPARLLPPRARTRTVSMRATSCRCSPSSGKCSRSSTGRAHPRVTVVRW